MKSTQFPLAKDESFLAALRDERDRIDRLLGDIDSEAMNEREVGEILGVVQHTLHKLKQKCVAAGSSSFFQHIHFLI